MAKYIRRKEIQEEIVEAEKSTMPTSADGKMVNIGDWIVTHSDGRKTVCSPEEFERIYNLYEEPIPKVAIAKVIEEVPFDIYSTTVKDGNLTTVTSDTVEIKPKKKRGRPRKHDKKKTDM